MPSPPKPVGLLSALLLAVAAFPAAGEITPEEAITAGLIAPQRVAWSSSGELVVVDVGAGGLVVLDPASGDVTARLPYAGVASVAVDWQDRWLVAGTFGARVIDRDGELVHELEPAAGPLQATDVAVDRDRERYVVLYGPAAHVVVYGAAGVPLFGFGAAGSGPGELSTPLAVAVGPAGETLVGDTGHGLVQVWSAGGGFLFAFGGRGSDPGEFQQLAGLAVGESGRVYASDAFQSWVQVFEPDGTLREVVGTFGSGLGELKTPIGLAVAEARDRLVVASLNSGSLQVFSLGTAAGGPAVDLAPESLDFGPQPVDTVSPTQSVSLTNTGDQPLVIDSIEVTGEFLRSHDCGASVGAGESCTVEVAFAPTEVGPASGELTIVDNAPDSPRSVGLEGVGTPEIVPPVVLGVGSVAATADGVVAEGEATSAGITQLTVVFSEPMNDPPGDVDSHDVTRPGNYLLLSPGVDGVFDTPDCAAGAQADDVPVAVDEVLYDEVSATAFLRLAGDLSLPRGGYRLLACGADALVDLAGNPLDGDGDGGGGDDFVRHFAVETTNLLSNPNFDRDLSFWTVTSPQPGEILRHPDDADSAPTSGSAQVMNLSGPGELFALSQCVAVEGGETYAFGGRARTASGSAEAPIAFGQVELFAEAGCGGTPLGTDLSEPVAGDTAMVWSDELRGLVNPPEDARSARVAFAVDAGSSPDFTSHFDNLFFYLDAGIFADGFESGETGAWSSVSP